MDRLDYAVDETIPALDNEFRAVTFWSCRCCGTLVSAPYMVSDDLWEAAKINKLAGQICLPCLDERVVYWLQRNLNIEDFRHHNRNATVLFGYNLGIKSR